MIERCYVLTLGCPDRTGIVARIAGFLAAAGGTITEASYHLDPDTGWFFTRQLVRADSLPWDVDDLRGRFGEVAREFGPQTEWRVTDTATRRRVVVLVSKESHCLYDLLGRVASRELDVDLRAVVGNHQAQRAITEAHGIPFHHVPFPPPGQDKSAAFARLAELVDEHTPDAIVLARFMQIIPDGLATAWAGRALNIHHSFLPSFVGARPYHQAHAAASSSSARPATT